MNAERDEIIRTEEDGGTETGVTETEALGGEEQNEAARREERRGKRLRTAPKPPEREGRTARPPERGTQRRNFGPHSPGPGNG